MSGNESKISLKKALDEHNIKVFEWRDIKVFKKPLGHKSLADRLELLEPYLKNAVSTNLEILSLDQKEYIVSGIGSSESHAKHLCHLLNKYTSVKASFVPIAAYYQNTSIDTTIPCILYSQGLSPNINICMQAYNYSKMIVITTVDETFSKRDRVESYKKLIANGSTVIKYPEEFPDDTLIRVQGPTAVFGLNVKIVETITKKPIANMEKLFKAMHKLNSVEIDDKLLANLIRSKNICIISSYPLSTFMGSIANKFMEGCFYPNPYLTDYLSFSHGVFQCIENAKFEKSEPFVVIMLTDEKSKPLAEKTKLMYDSEYIFEYKLEMDEELMIIEAEILFNRLIFSLIYIKNIDQFSWKGKEKQNVLYEIQSVFDADKDSLV